MILEFLGPKIPKYNPKIGKKYGKITKYQVLSREYVIVVDWECPGCCLVDVTGHDGSVGRVSIGHGIVSHS